MTVRLDNGVTEIIATKYRNGSYLPFRYGTCLLLENVLLTEILENVIFVMSEDN
jgi:hypothetical protein